MTKRAIVVLLLVGCSREPSDRKVLGVEAPATSPAASSSARSEPMKTGDSSPKAAPSAASIGQATMDPDGTIVLMLRAEGPSGAVGDGMIRYPKGHKDYDDVLKHLGGLKPGETKPVPPWPDTP